MSQPAPLAWCLCATLLGGCAALELPKASATPVEVVPLSVAVPVACAPLETIEVRSGLDAAPTREALDSYAREHGATLVVVDSFTVREGGADTLVVMRARLFVCTPPEAQRVPSASVMVSAPSVCAHEENTSAAVQSALR
jgi:hypothetical protein